MILHQELTSAIAESRDMGYGPFGETLRSTGSQATSNPWRFSTKYSDQESGWVYYWHRYYSPQSGRWISRDALGEGESLSLVTFLINAPSDSVDSDGLRRVSSRDAYWEEWEIAHPERDRAFDKKRQARLDRGCVGVTCLNLGKSDPPKDRCYRTRDLATQHQLIMKRECECNGMNASGGASQPRLFSIRLYVNPDRPDVSFDSTGKADMSGWRRQAKSGDSYPFDYGFVTDGETVLHANHVHNPGGYLGPMSVYEDPLNDWRLKGSQFNLSVWCVACDDEVF